MKRLFLVLFIGSVSVSALVGVIVMIVGSFGEFESRVLATAFTVTCTSILGLACGAAVESRKGGWLPWVGIVLAVASAIGWFAIIWSDDILPDIVGRSILSATLVAVAIAHFALVSFAKLESRYRWTVYAAWLSVAGLIGIILSIIWFDDRVIESDIVMRTLGVLAILTAALTIVIPILHRLSNIYGSAEEIDADIAKLQKRIEELEARRKEIGGSKQKAVSGER